MRQKFFTNTTYSKFIQGLIANTPIPIYHTVRQGDYIIKNCLYIYKSHVIKCTVTGLLGTTASYKDVQNYVFGYKYKQFTENYISSYGYYDSELHKHLGDLLRCYRDIYDVNLMPFYNCFGGVYEHNIWADASGVMSSTEDFTNYKFLRVPIKYNTTYTIAVDSPAEVVIAPMIMGKNGLVFVPINNQSINLTGVLGAQSGNIKVVGNSDFKSPITACINNKQDIRISSAITLTPDFLQRYERDLCLCIRLHSSNNSSVVVLEGDYTKVQVDKIFNIENIDDIDNFTLDNLLLSNLNLLQFSDEVRYPFSNMLLSYLLTMVITNRDEISEDIIRVQSELGILSDQNILKGVWNNYLRAYIYTNFRNQKRNTKIDKIGFVDKDVEYYLLKKGEHDG